MPEQAENFGTALYYPFINIQDTDWLKGALLYWETIRCITPSTGYFQDEIKYLSDEGVIIATDPQPYSANASLIFAKKMQKYCHNQGELDSKVRKYLEEKFPELKDITIHEDKFSEQIFRELGQKVLLGHPDKSGVIKFYHAQPYITLLYLAILAKEMSKEINTPMLTDVSGLSGLEQHILWSEEIIPSKTEPENFLLQLDINFPSQKELKKLSFDDILNFRQKRIDERQRFRKTIENIRSKAQELKDSNALADYLNEQKHEIQRATSDHQKTLHDIGIKNLTSLLNIAWPSLFGIAVGQIAGGLAGVLSAIGAMGISLAYSKIKISQEYRKAIKDCPWHYLINLEQEL